MISQQIDTPGGIDYCFYSSPEPNTAKLLLAAIEHFGSLHCGVPDMVIIEFWRRLTSLPADQWHGFYYGPIKVSILSPHDAPPEFQGVALLPDIVLCVRKNMELIDRTVEATDFIIASIGDIHEPTNVVSSS
jgi:hypothetical protein